MDRDLVSERMTYAAHEYQAAYYDWLKTRDYRDPPRPSVAFLEGHERATRAILELLTAPGATLENVIKQLGGQP